MKTALDSSVILDVVTDDPHHSRRSERALRQAAAEGALLISECVLAEIRPAFSAGDAEQFLLDWNIEFVASTLSSALLAGAMFERYLSRRKPGRGRVAADFLIGAHALVCGDRLLARDRGFYRDYFKDLRVMSP